MARDLYDDHFKAVESMPRGVVVTLRNIATQLESAWELHANRQVSVSPLCFMCDISGKQIMFRLVCHDVKKSHSMSEMRRVLMHVLPS